MQPLTEPDFPILLIVGAGRSGTNFVARMFEQDDRFLNLYENRYIWNYRQRDRRTDYRDPAEATPEVTAYIRRHFARMVGDSGRILVDKTPGNALRLDFVRAVLPQARIVNVLRDGRANVLSRGDLWDAAKAPAERGQRYLRHFGRMRARGNLPTDRMGAFIADNAAQRLRALLGRVPLLEGERVAGLGAIARTHGMAVARAVQWRETVMQAVIAGRRMGSATYHELRLEDLGTDADAVAAAIWDFVGLAPGSGALAHLTTTYDAARAERWRETSATGLLARLEPVLRPTLEYLDYQWSQVSPADTACDDIGRN